jgi:hypothetical protein
MALFDTDESTLLQFDEEGDSDEIIENVGVLDEVANIISS